MINSRIVVGLLWAVLQPLAAVMGQEAPPDTSLAVISVESEYAGQPVILDGQPIGVTPLQFHPISPGNHTLIVRRSARHSWLYLDWVQRFYAAPGDTLMFRAAFKRVYFVRSHPFGARVYRDGQYLGTTPLTFEAEDTARVRLTLEKEGYNPAVVVWEPKDDNRINVILEPINAFWISQEKAQREVELRRSRRRKMAWISGGISILAGTAAILFKKKADRAYAAYQKTAHPDRMQQYIAEAGKYDRYSSVTFGVFQVSFGLGFYFFLRSNHP